MSTRPHTHTAHTGAERRAAEGRGGATARRHEVAHLGHHLREGHVDSRGALLVEAALQEAAAVLVPRQGGHAAGHVRGLGEARLQFGQLAVLRPARPAARVGHGRRQQPPAGA